VRSGTQLPELDRGHSNPCDLVLSAESNLAAGVLQQLAGIVLKALSVFPYVFVYDHFGVRWLRPGSWHSCTLALVLVDLVYYVFHRTCHEVNILWAGHIVHHSSPDYNLSTALRQGVGETATGFLFSLPLALLIPPRDAFLMSGINTAYQFLTHTELVGSLGPLDWVLSTPSNHRVHHARNYPKANFSGMFIVWDRLFGTYVPEQREDRTPVYGLDARKVPVGSWNALWHQIHQYVAIAVLWRRKGARALMVRMAAAGAVASSRGESRELPGLSWADVHSVLQFTATVGFFFGFMPAVRSGGMPLLSVLVGVGMSVWAVASATRILDLPSGTAGTRAPHILGGEAVRLLATYAGLLFIRKDLGSTSQAILSLASLPFTLLSLASVGAMAKAHLFPQHDPELHKAS